MKIETVRNVLPYVAVAAALMTIDNETISMFTLYFVQLSAGLIMG